MAGIVWWTDFVSSSLLNKHLYIYVKHILSILQRMLFFSFVLCFYPFTVDVGILLEIFSPKICKTANIILYLSSNVIFG